MTVRPATAAFLLFGLALAPAVALAAPVSLEGLKNNSPFAQPAVGPASVASDTPLEFRGVLVDGGEHFFSLYDPTARVGMWVGMNEPGNPFTVQSYDAEKATAVVQYKGRALNLTLKEAKVVTLVPNNPPLPGPAGPAGPPPAQTVHAAQGDEAARLAAVADEIRRRRAMRAQGAQVLAPRPAPAQPKQN